MFEEDFELDEEGTVPPVVEETEEKLNDDLTEEEKEDKGFQRGEWAE